MNKFKKKPISLIFFFLALLVVEQAILARDTAIIEKEEIFKTVSSPKKKKKKALSRAEKKRKESYLKRRGKRYYRNRFDRKKRRRAAASIRTLSFQEAAENSQALLAQEEAEIASLKGVDKNSLMESGISYLKSINDSLAETAPTENHIKIGSYFITSEITQETFDTVIMPHLPALVTLSIIRSLLADKTKVRPNVFTANQQDLSVIEKNKEVFFDSIKETHKYKALEKINPTELNKIVLCALAIYNDSKNAKKKDDHEGKLTQYTEKIRQYFRPTSKEHITKLVEEGLNKARKIFDNYYGAADSNLPESNLNLDMIMYAMCFIGNQEIHIFEKINSSFIADMITSVSIEKPSKKEKIDASAEQKREMYEYYKKVYTNMTGTSSLMLQKVKAFYARTKQFITAAENRGLLKIGAALVAGTVIAGTVGYDVYTAKKNMIDTEGTLKDALKVGASYSAGRPKRAIKSAWEGAKGLGSRAKSAWESRPSLKEVAEKPGQKYREWKWNRVGKQLKADELRAANDEDDQIEVHPWQADSNEEYKEGFLSKVKREANKVKQNLKKRFSRKQSEEEDTELLEERAAQKQAFIDKMDKEKREREERAQKQFEAEMNETQENVARQWEGKKNSDEE
ncbi:hypothetical protein E6Q11_05555 [Candidatus Dojkabacteria bacterium]|uniref:Uncharacterized protein n=1 Tax=Candidatus Dojkabacteria bacterium TaxID=2099670 RepID=A0A5C7J3F5_9BACT|nr:MAG: hypothetical protein E6Q11_05555 [Candidatus Dojkabacteria bacterium]